MTEVRQGPTKRVRFREVSTLTRLFAILTNRFKTEYLVIGADLITGKKVYIVTVIVFQPSV